ncbi:MAG: SH3 domain-containing protein [Saprospiraceae bacterium]|nr:SH3 domain-containing protein [Saprospiraceae bacterium]
MNYLLSFLFLLSYGVNSNLTQATLVQDNTNHHYVWARDGLNVRSGPGTNYEIIATLNFGDSIEVVRKTAKKCNIYAVSKVDTNYYYSENETVGPLILYGEWIQIKTNTGKEGFVINQYILKVKPHLTNNEKNWMLIDMPLESTDSSFFYNANEGELMWNEIVHRYEGNVVQIESRGNVWWQTEIEFDGYTFQEVIVIMNIEDETTLVLRNWKEEVELIEEGQICNIFLVKKGSKIIYMESCSC